MCDFGVELSQAIPTSTHTFGWGSLRMWLIGSFVFWCYVTSNLGPHFVYANSHMNCAVSGKMLENKLFLTILKSESKSIVPFKITFTFFFLTCSILILL